MFLYISVSHFLNWEIGNWEFSHFLVSAETISKVFLIFLPVKQYRKLSFPDNLIVVLLISSDFLVFSLLKFPVIKKQ